MNTRRQLAILYAISWVTDFAGILLIFTISRELAQGGAGLLKMGLVGGGWSFVQAVCSFVSGHLSDRIGRRRTVLGGMLFLLAASAGCLILPADTPGSFAAYFAGGVSIGVVFPPVIAWINRGHEADPRSRGISRNMLLFCLSWNLGVVSAQASGGWLFPIGRAWPLGLAVGLAAVNVVLLLLTGRRTTRPAPARQRPAAEPRPAERGIARAFTAMGWIANLGGAFSASMILHLFPKLAVELGVPPEQHGTTLATMRVVAVAAFLSMHFSRFWQYRFWPSLAVQLAAVAGLLVLVLADSLAALTAGLMGIGLLLGYNYFSSIFYSNAGGGDERRGFASGMHEATLGLGGGAGALLGGLVGQAAGPRAPYLLAVGLVAVLIVAQAGVYLRRVRPLRRLPR